MVIPWAGFSLSKLLAQVEPTSAREVRRVRDAATTRRACPNQSTDVLRVAVRRGPAPRRGDAPAHAPRDRALRPRAAAAGRRAGPARRAVEVRLQGHQVDRQDHARRRRSRRRRGTATAPSEYGFFANVNPKHAAPALEPGDRAADRRVRAAARRSCSTATASRSRASTRGWISMSTSSSSAGAARLPDGEPRRSEAREAARHRQRPRAGGRARVGRVPRAARRQRGQLRDPHDGPASASCSSTLSLAVTPLRRLTGWNQLIAVRRNLGVFGFFYIAAHFTIFFVFDRDASVTSTLQEIVERVYLWFGFGALVLMIPLARHVDRRDGHAARRAGAGSSCTGSRTRS